MASGARLSPRPRYIFFAFIAQAEEGRGDDLAAMLAVGPLG